MSVRPSITDQTFLDVDFFCALIGFKSKNYIEKVTFIKMLLRKIYRVLRYLEKFSMKIRSTGLPYTISLIVLYVMSSPDRHDIDIKNA